MEFMGRVFRIFRRRIWEDGSFTEDLRKQIMRQLNTAFYEAQAEVYREVIADDAG